MSIHPERGIISNVDLRGRITRRDALNPVGEVKNMPNIKSAIKRVKVSKKKNLRNRMIKSGVKTAVKKYEADVNAEKLSGAFAALDKAVSKGVIHKNVANRKKARLSKKLAAQ